MNYRPVLNGEHYLTGNEVCRRLCISKRTLQDYRDTGLLGYVQLPGKIIYRESDIMDLLERFYQKWNLENMESCFIAVLLPWKIEVLKYSCLVCYIVWLIESQQYCEKNQYCWLSIEFTVLNNCIYIIYFTDFYLNHVASSYYYPVLSL